ncbi:MAG: hypothetical protein ACRCXZ_03960 [Patescibacteria group bacterium]
MKPKNKRVVPSEKNSKKMQELIYHVTYFTTTAEKLKGIIINIKYAKYNFANNTLTVGYTTLDGKYGTAKERLLKCARDLSDYLFSLNLYRQPPKIEFKVKKEDDQIEKVKNLLLKLDELNNGDKLA